MMRLPIWLALALLFCAPAASFAAFLQDGWGARPVGMGGAFTAVADDSNAPLFNPAGLSQLNRHEFTAMYARLYLGETFYLGNTGETTSFGQSYLSYASKYRPELGGWGVSWANFTTAHLYREDTVTLSYARRVDDFFELDTGLSVGLNVKYLRHSYTESADTDNDAVFAKGNSAGAPSVDIGVLYQPRDVLKGLRLGISGLNLNEPNVGLLDKDPVPAEWRFGAAYLFESTTGLLPAADFTLREGVLNVHGGFESWLFQNMLGLRAGFNRNEGAAGLSFYQQVGNKLGFRLDYAFTVPFRIEGTSGSHRFSGTVMF